jgi:hypothetical protein
MDYLIFSNWDFICHLLALGAQAQVDFGFHPHLTSPIKGEGVILNILSPLVGFVVSSAERRDVSML